MIITVCMTIDMFLNLIFIFIYILYEKIVDYDLLLINIFFYYYFCQDYLLYLFI